MVEHLGCLAGMVEHLGRLAGTVGPLVGLAGTVGPLVDPVGMVEHWIGIGDQVDLLLGRGLTDRIPVLLED